MFDRAEVGSTSFTCTLLEGSKKAKDSLVIVHEDEELKAGRVQAFMSHAPPGTDSGDQEDEINIAYVHWYRSVPLGQPRIDPVLGCPVFGWGLMSNASGSASSNMCLVQHILPCKVACFPHHHGARRQVVMVSRFASFLGAMPDLE